MFWKVALDIFEDMMLLTLSAYMLWCFYVGIFRESIAVIRWAEYVTLYGLCGFSIFRLYWHLKPLL